MGCPVPVGRVGGRRRSTPGTSSSATSCATASMSRTSTMPSTSTGRSRFSGSTFPGTTAWGNYLMAGRVALSADEQRPGLSKVEGLRVRGKYYEVGAVFNYAIMRDSLPRRQLCPARADGQRRLLGRARAHAVLAADAEHDPLHRCAAGCERPEEQGLPDLHEGRRRTGSGSPSSPWAGPSARPLSCGGGTGRRGSAAPCAWAAPSSTSTSPTRRRAKAASSRATSPYDLEQPTRVVVRIVDDSPG